MILTLTMVGVLVCCAIIYIGKQEQQREGSELHERLGDCAEKTLNKYKIVVPYLQVLSVIVTLYPITLPDVFSWFVERISRLVFLDMDMDCLFPSSFHGKLLMMTCTPPIFVTMGVIVLFVRKKRNPDSDHVQAKAMAAIIIFLLTMFPIISTVVVQTFVYDTRLDDGFAYLKADYAVEKSDDTQRIYVPFAIVMSIVYCIGIPTGFACALRAYKESICELQVIEACIALLQRYNDDERCLETETQQAQLATAKSRGTGSNEEVLRALHSQKMKENPILGGLSPLYCDYRAECWFFEIPKLMVTLLLCGILTLVPMEESSQVFAALVVSVSMSIVNAGCRPYLAKSDQQLAQLCHISLAFTLAVGLLEKAAGASFASLLFGVLLMTTTCINLADGFGTIAKELLKALFPERIGELLEKVDDFIPSFLSNDYASRNFSAIAQTKKTSIKVNAVAPLPDPLVPLDPVPRPRQGMNTTM